MQVNGKNQMKSKLFLSLAILFVAGCYTPYQQNSFMGGWSETWLAPDVVEVSFRGNGYTSAERVQDLAILHAEERMEKAGFNFFTFGGGKHSESVQDVQVTPDQARTQGTATVSPSLSGANIGYSSQTTFTPGTSIRIQRHRVSLTVQGYKFQPIGVRSFDANFVIASLRHKYNLTATPAPSVTNSPPATATNPFTKFYHDKTENMPTEEKQRLQLPASAPEIHNVATDQLANESLRMAERGFAQIGYSTFGGSRQSLEYLTEQALKVQAEIVLYNEHPTNATYFQGAWFWQRLKVGHLGAFGETLPDDIRTKLQRNTGDYVTAVVDNGPAFRANILRGDVIVQVGEMAISTPQDLRDAVNHYSGQKVQFHIIRDTQPLLVEVQLNGD